VTVRRSTIRAVATLVAVVVAIPCRAWTDDAVPPFEKKGDKLCHTGTYESRKVVWTARPDIEDVRDIFAHPVFPRRLYLAAAAGVFRSDDAGETWRGVAGLATERVGAVTDVAFRPDESDTMYAATHERGVWKSTDGGATAECVGSKANGMAGDGAVCIVSYSGTPTFDVLLVGHGEDLPGISRSLDGGRSWDVMDAKYCVRQLVCARPGRREIYMVAGHKNDPEVLNLYHAPSFGQFWRELLADILPVDVRREVQGDGLYVATVDAGVYRISEGGGRIERLGPETMEWASVESVWGGNADRTELCLYDPRKLGMVSTVDRLQTVIPQTHGLYTGTFVREGARIRANADSSRFLAAINGVLYVGRNAKSFRVDDPTTNPAIVTIDAAVLNDRRWREFDYALRRFTESADAAALAGDLADQLAAFEAAVPDTGIRLTARVSTPGGVSPRQVTVDLTRLGMSERAPLYDDGEHGDGGAEDGVYGGLFDLDYRAIGRHDHDWRATWPGAMPLTVTAVLADGRMAGGIALFSFFARPDTFDFFSEYEDVAVQDAEGQARGSRLYKPDAARTGNHYIELLAGPGKWLAPCGTNYRTHSVSGYYALSFYVRPVGKPDDELRVHLRDNRVYTYPVMTEGVPIVAEGFVEGGGMSPDTWQRVIIPVERFTQEPDGFLPDLLGWVVFSGDSRSQRTYCIDDIRFYLTKAELDKEREEAE